MEAGNTAEWASPFPSIVPLTEIDEWLLAESAVDKRLYVMAKLVGMNLPGIIPSQHKTSFLISVSIQTWRVSR